MQMELKKFDDVSNNAYWFIFYNDELLVNENAGSPNIPFISANDMVDFELTEVQDIGSLDGHTCYVASLATKNIPTGFALKGVRQLYGHTDDRFFWFAFRAFHVLYWLKNNKFCGCCGCRMNVLATELAVECVHCNHLEYPRISPAIIVAVVKDHQILLAHSTRFPAGMFSVIAGYVDPGETLEDCVRRELQEEVGIEVSNIKYFGNQPWPFPDSLMVAFTAEYAHGIITVDNVEIVEADWFSAHDLPNIPPKESIARKLIDWFVESECPCTNG